MQKAVILLDALGTLLELKPPAPALRAELANRFRITVTEEQAHAALAAEIAYYRAHLDEGRDADSLATLRNRCAGVLREALPPTEQLAAVDERDLTAALLASVRFRPFDDVVPALEAMKAAGRRLVVVSNWDVSLHVVLDRLGLTRYLDGIITSAEAGARKPAPGIFAKALTIARANPQDAIHIGDSLDEDVAGARAAGIEPVLIRRNGHPGPSGVRTIASLNVFEP
jgi:putative hydrolase of the HAD superfamily